MQLSQTMRMILNLIEANCSLGLNLMMNLIIRRVGMIVGIVAHVLTKMGSRS